MLYRFEIFRSELFRQGKVCPLVFTQFYQIKSVYVQELIKFAFFNIDENLDREELRKRVGLSRDSKLPDYHYDVGEIGSRQKKMSYFIYLNQRK